MTWQLGSKPGVVDAIDKYGRPMEVADQSRERILEIERTTVPASLSGWGPSWPFQDGVEIDRELERQDAYSVKVAIGCVLGALAAGWFVGYGLDWLGRLAKGWLL